MSGAWPIYLSGSYFAGPAVRGWKTYKYDYETVELPNPRPTQPKKKKWLKVAFWPLFPTANNFRRLVGIGFIYPVLSKKQTTSEKPDPAKLSANALLLFVHLIMDDGVEQVSGKL